MGARKPALRGRPAASLRLAAVLASVAILASACVAGGGSASKGSAGSTKSATLTFWTINLKKEFSGYITGLIRSYQSAHRGIRIKWVDVPGTDIATKLLSALASGNVPDVVNIDSANLGAFQARMANLNTYFSSADLADFEPGLLNSLRSNGKLTAIPWYNGGAPVGIYNMKIMRRSGFKPDSPPASYSQVLALAQRVHNRTKVYGTNEIPSYIDGFSSVLAYEGIPLLTADKKHAAFDTPRAQQVLKQFKQAYDSHAIAPGAVTANIRAFPQSLDNGQIAFQADAFPFVLTELQQNAPSVYKNLAITKAPATADGKWLLLGQQTLAVPQASRHQAAAADFIKFVADGKNQLAFDKLVAIYPSTISTTKDPFFTHNTGASPIDRARKVILSELPNLVDGQLPSPKSPQLSDDLSTQVRSFMQGSVSASQALSTAASQWNSLLAGGQ